MIVNSKVVRRPQSTLVSFGPEPDAVYKFSQADVTRIEHATGRALEFLTEDELVGAMQHLVIESSPLDDQDRIVIAAAAGSADDALILAAMDLADEPGVAPTDETGRTTETVDAEEPPEESVEAARAAAAAPPPPIQPPVDLIRTFESRRANRSPWIIVGIVAAAAVIVLLVLSLAGVFRGSEEPPAPVETPTIARTIEVPTPSTGEPTATATANTLVRSGPGPQYNVIGALLAGQSATVVGVSADQQWWVIDFPGTPSGQGWVPDATVATENVVNVPIVQAPPAPTPTPTPPFAITDWLGEYFDNRDLQGTPVVTRNDETIRFNWGTEPPAPGMPAENWSARWTITRDVPAGTYRFSAWVDDGTRVFIDDNLIIDGWQEGGGRNYTVDVNVTAGTHRVRVEYFQAAGVAFIQLGIGYVDEYPDWKGEYFDNPDVSGSPVVVRNDQAIDFNWGANSPAPGVPANNYSVRWTRQASFEQGSYVFQVNVEGGTRLWFDGRLLVDSWQNLGFRSLQGETGPVSQGTHDLRVEYFKLSGNGRIAVSWGPQQAYQPPTARISGPTAAQVDEQVRFSAGSSQPAPGSQIVSYQWTFGDGTGSDGVDVVKTYSQPGTYAVQLTVTDDKGLTGTASQSIEVSVAPPTQAPPTASINAPSLASVGQAVSFDASGSSAPAPIVTYRWTFGDGGTANAIRVEHVYNQAGTYVVSLVVVDQLGQEGESSMQINVVAEATPEPTLQPTATPTVTPTPTEPPPELPLVGTVWGLTFLSNGQGGLQQILLGTTITATFADDDTLSGSSGCNPYSASFATEGSDLTVDALSTGGQICQEPAGVMQQETTYQNLLTLVQSYRIDGTTLRLLNGSDQTILQYQPAATPAGD